MATQASFNVTGKSAACARSNRYVEISFRWGIGSVVYDCVKASKTGVLEYVTIKDVRVVQNVATFGLIVPLYVDTFNWYWNEDELCDETTARSLAKQYWEEQQELQFQMVASCSTPG